MKQVVWLQKMWNFNYRAVANAIPTQKDYLYIGVIVTGVGEMEWMVKIVFILSAG